MSEIVDLYNKNYHNNFKQMVEENNRLEEDNELYKQAHKTEQDRRRKFEQCLDEIRELLFVDACAKCPYGEEVAEKCERNIEPCVLRLKGHILYLIKQAKEDE